ASFCSSLSAFITDCETTRQGSMTPATAISGTSPFSTSAWAESCPTVVSTPFLRQTRTYCAVRGTEDKPRNSATAQTAAPSVAANRHTKTNHQEKRYGYRGHPQSEQQPRRQLWFYRLRDLQRHCSHAPNHEPAQ